MPKRSHPNSIEKDRVATTLGFVNGPLEDEDDDDSDYVPESDTSSEENDYELAASSSGDEEDDNHEALASSSSAEEDDAELQRSSTTKIKRNMLYDKTFLLALSKRMKQQIDHDPERFQNSVLDISNTFIMDDHSHPWLAKTTASCSGSGFVLIYKDTLFILTNAHVAEMSSFLTVRLADQSKKFTAKLIHLEHDCDLALLDVEDDEFWTHVIPLELAEMPAMRSSLAVVGFPRCGNELCITEGTVSRVEVDEYIQGNTLLLQVQVTAPINPGNSGGPVINPLGKVVGVAFQGNDGDGEGFMIPPQVIKHFLDDFMSPKRPYQGFPELAFTFQPMQNRVMKEYYGTGDCGIIVSKVHKLSGLRDLLKPKDIILALDGVPLKDDATIETEFSKRMHFDYLVAQKQIGDSIVAIILRDGKKLEVTLPLKYRAKTTTKGGNFTHDIPPSYLIVCGIVLQVLTEDLNDEKGSESLAQAIGAPKKELGQAIVVISHVFPNEYTKGYEAYANPMQIVTHVNGVKILNLHHAAELIEANDDEHHVLKTQKGHTIPVQNIGVDEHLELLKTFRVTKDRSDDLLVRQVYKPGCPEYEAQQMELQAAAGRSRFRVSA